MAFSSRSRAPPGRTTLRSTSAAARSSRCTDAAPEQFTRSPVSKAASEVPGYRLTDSVPPPGKDRGEHNTSDPASSGSARLAVAPCLGHVCELPSRAQALDQAGPPLVITKARADWRAARQRPVGGAIDHSHWRKASLSARKIE